MYETTKPVSGSICTPHGEVDFEFTAGEHTPKNADEQLALEHLVSIGAAERTESKPRPRRSTKQED